MKSKASLWASIPLLSGALVLILGLARGTLMTVLLIAVFFLWGAWVVLALLLPSWRTVQSYRRREREAQRRRNEIDIAAPGVDLSNVLLLHVNHRISASLKEAYPNASWDWAVENPALLVVQGGIGRIHVYNVPDHDYADVSFDTRGGIACSMVKSLAESAQPHGKKHPIDPQAWFEQQGREMLSRLVGELDSRGHRGMILNEDGSIRVRPVDGGEEFVENSFRSFPDKVYWPKLVSVLEQFGLSATAQDHCIALSW